MREVVFAAFRAFCCRARVWPPFLAAALRFDADARELDPDEREPEDERLRVLADERLLLDEERLLDERLDPLAFFLPPDPPLLRLSAMYCPSLVPPIVV